VFFDIFKLPKVTTIENVKVCHTVLHHLVRNSFLLPLPTAVVAFLVFVLAELKKTVESERGGEREDKRRILYSYTVL